MDVHIFVPTKLISFSLELNMSVVVLIHPRNSSKLRKLLILINFKSLFLNIDKNDLGYQSELIN